MNIRIIPRPLHGSVTPPPSKSMAHRLLICAALADGKSVVHNIAESEDALATMRCMTALGASFRAENDDRVVVQGIGAKSRSSDIPQMDCGESGSTLRFTIPIALALASGGRFIGRGRLMQRSLQPYFDLFAQKGITCEKSGNVLTVSGELSPGKYSLAGNVSSQFFSGLMFALPLLRAPCVISATTRVESRDYILMTLDALDGVGKIALNPSETGFEMRTEPDVYKPFERSVEADWSQAAFWYAARFLGNDVNPCGLNPESVQGDRVIQKLCTDMSQTGIVCIDMSDIPDLLPSLAVMATGRNGETRFLNAARLRLKESDRLKTTSAMLRALGGHVKELPDGLIVSGGALTGGVVDGANDHRIVMAAAIAAGVCSGQVTVTGADAVNKSYPSFFEDYIRLGGEIHVV